MCRTGVQKLVLILTRDVVHVDTVQADFSGLEKPVDMALDLGRSPYPCQNGGTMRVLTRAIELLRGGDARELIGIEHAMPPLVVRGTFGFFLGWGERQRDLQKQRFTGAASIAECLAYAP